MTAVVLVGDLPGTGIISEPVAWRVPDSAMPEATLAFVGQMADALQRYGAALVVYPTWRQQAAVRLVRQARGYLATDRIASLAVDLPPLAVSLISDQLAFMAPHIRPGVLASIVQVLADRVYAGAWVSSVAKLEHVETGLGQHMASLMPRSGFMVTVGAKPGVHRLTAARPVPAIRQRPLDPVLMLAAHENGDVSWLQNRLKPELRGTSLTFVAGQPLSPQYWGTKKYAEFVAFSGHPRDLHLALEAVQCTPCSWCGEPTALAVCPFCSRMQDRPTVRSADPAAGPAADTTAPAAGITAPQEPPATPPWPEAPARAPTDEETPSAPVPMPMAAPTPAPTAVQPPAPRSPDDPQPPPPFRSPQSPPPPPPPPEPSSPPQSFGGSQVPPAPQPDPVPDRPTSGGRGREPEEPARERPAATEFAPAVTQSPEASSGDAGRNGDRPPEQRPSDSGEITRTGTIEFRPFRDR